MIIQDTITYLVDLSLASTQTGPSIEVKGSDLYSIEAVVTAASSLNGTLKIQVSVSGNNWSDLTGSTLTLTTDGTSIYSISEVAYNYVRLVWTRTGGSGTLNATVSRKRSS